MQVSYASEHVTHAIIGGGETINFGISNSAEFFNILSSTLYKDQILAVVRESLCNAWDAHIEAGKTAIAVAITLTSDKLIIRDSGKGIHHDDIGLIYGTYGNSTKKNDGQQTGGFGLGCKSPFAYTDHFEVISDHDGVRTIYAMAKSSAEVGGKPGIKTIAQFPTTETGLSVTINIKHSDSSRFKELLQRIARNGDMNATLNGAAIPCIGFDQTKSNWMVTSQPILDEHTPVALRYGNVIYPVDGGHKDLHELHHEVCTLRNLVVAPSHSYNQPQITIVFQAPPHSIAVTPSRESLSMQDHTVNTIKKLYKDFLFQYKTESVGEEKRILKACVKEAVDKKDLPRLLSREQKLPFSFKQDDPVTPILSIPSFVSRAISLRYPERMEFRKEDLKLRISELAKAGLIERGHAATYLADLEQVNYMDGRRSRMHRSEWVQKRILTRMRTKLVAAGLDTDSLLVCDTNDRSTNIYGQYRQNGVPVKSQTFVSKDLYSSLPYLQNIVVLSSSRTNIFDRVRSINSTEGPLLPHQYNQLDGYMVYITGRKKGDREAALAFFEKMRVTIIDMELLEVKEEAPARAAAVAKPRLKGLALLKCVGRGNRSYIDTAMARSESSDRITEPEFVVLNQTVRSDVSNCLPQFSGEESAALVSVFGEVGGIANTPSQYEVWRKKYPSVFAYITPKVLEYVRNSTAIQDYFSTAENKAWNYVSGKRHGVYSLISTIYKTKELRKHYHIVDNRTDMDKLYTTLFHSVMGQATADEGLTAVVRTEANGWKECDLALKFKAMLDRTANSKMLGLIDIHSLDRFLTDQTNKQKALQTFFYALNN